MYVNVYLLSFKHYLTEDTVGIRLFMEMNFKVKY